MPLFAHISIIDTIYFSCNQLSEKPGYVPAGEFIQQVLYWEIKNLTGGL